MRKPNLFDASRVISLKKGTAIERSVYNILGDGEKEGLPFVEFNKKPTKYTKILFKELLNNYDIKENTSIISNNNAEKLEFQGVDMFEESSIINSMLFGYYDVVKIDDDDYTEVHLKYPVITKEFITPTDRRYTFDGKFKNFYDNYFIVD